MLTEKCNFNEIYEEYKNLVLKIAYMYSEDYIAAEDIMQDTFLRLYKEIDEKPHPNVKAWLCTTAKYLAINYKKQAARRETKEVSVIEIMGPDGNDFEINRESTEEEYFEEQKEKERLNLHERIFSHLVEKNPKWYEAIMLVCVQGYLQVDAAKKMNMSEDAFYVMLHRARTWIKKNYGVEYDELNRF